MHLNQSSGELVKIIIIGSSKYGENRRVLDIDRLHTRRQQPVRNFVPKTGGTTPSGGFRDGRNGRPPSSAESVKILILIMQRL